MNVIAIARDVVDCELNLIFWYERKQGESCFLSIHLPLGNVVLLVIVRPTLLPQLALNES